MKGYFNKEHKWVNINTASNTPIADLSNSYDSNNVEGALQEAAAKDLLLQNKSDEHTKKIQELDESVEWLKANGGGGGGTGSGGSVLPNLTSTLTGDIVVPKGKEIILPIFFTSPNMGNGTLIVIVNGVQKDTITIKQGSLEVNIGALTELRNTLKIYVKDRAGLLSNELSWTVINGGIGLTLDFDYMSDYTTDHEILMRYYIDTEESSPQLQVTVDGKTSTVTCVVGYNEFYFNNMAPGIHAVEVKAISGNFVSETYTFNLVVINSETLYVSTTFNSGEEIMYGLPVSVPYRTSYKDDTPITVNMYLNNELQKTLTAKRGSYAWTLGAINVGDYTYKIEAKLGDKTSSVEGSFKVVQGDYTPVTINTAGLRYRLDPVGRSNEDTDKESFIYDNGKEQITTTIYGSNFASNGWIDNSLKLDGGSYGIIDYSPWEDNVINGSTIEVVFTSTDIGKPDTKVIEYKDKNTNKGLYVGLEQACMSSTSKQNLVSIYPGEKTTVSFVVDRKNKFCKVYVNGICTRAFMLSDSGSGTSAIYESLNFDNGKIYLNANNNEEEQGVVLIHDIRIYARTLSDDEIVKNVIALETDMAKQKTMYDFMFDNNTLPVMRMTGDASDMSDVNKKVMRIQYSSPNTEKYGQPFDLPYCKVYFQGTSSLAYVRKNYSIELYDDYMADYYYCPYPNGVEDRLFCLKADYMESSHARNVGITRLINEYFYDSKNPAQLKDSKVTNSIQGFPMLLYMNDEFLGVYNFNVDRYSAKSFGYTDEDTTLVYEISANSDTTAGAFFKYDKENTSSTELDYYRQDFMCLYPPTRVAGNDNYAEIIKLVEWVDNASEEEFVDNLEQHFNKEYLIKYYIFANLFGAVDSLGKNMKLASWDGGNIWYLQMYDCDTTCGLDNTGFDKFASDIEIGDVNVYNTTSSKLWAKVGLYLLNEIKTVYADMRQKGLRYENIINCIVTNQIDKIPATFYNKDTQTKYLDFGSTYLYAVHGNDKQHMSLWLKDRLLYLDTLWDYDASTIDYVTVRSSKLGDIYMDIETFKNMYLKVKWRNDATGASIQKLRISKTKPTRFSFKSVTETDQEILIYGGQYIKSLGDLTNLSPTTISLNSATKINNLICHSDKLINVEVSACTNLQKIDLSNCTNLGTGTGASTVLDVSSCSELKYLNIQNTTLQGVQLNPKGSNIKEVWYPKSIQTVSFANCPQLETVGLEEGHSCNELRLVNCPNVTMFGDRSYSDTYKEYLYLNSKFLNGVQNIYIDASCLSFTEWEMKDCNKGFTSIVIKNVPNMKKLVLGVNNTREDVYYTKGKDFGGKNLSDLLNKKDCTIELNNTGITELIFTAFQRKSYSPNWRYDREYDYSGTPNTYHMGSFSAKSLDISNTKLEKVKFLCCCDIYKVLVPSTLIDLVVDSFFDMHENFYANATEYYNIGFENHHYGDGKDNLILDSNTTFGSRKYGIGSWAIGNNLKLPNACNGSTLWKVWCPGNAEEPTDVTDDTGTLAYTWDLKGLKLNTCWLWELNTAMVYENGYFLKDEYNNDVEKGKGYNGIIKPMYNEYKIQIRNMDLKCKEYQLVTYPKAFYIDEPYINCTVDYTEFTGMALNFGFAYTKNLNYVMPKDLEAFVNIPTYMYRTLFNMTSEIIGWDFVETIYPKATALSDLMFRGVTLKEQTDYDTEGIYLNNEIVDISFTSIGGESYVINGSWFKDSNLRYVKGINLKANCINNMFGMSKIVKVGDINLGINATSIYYRGIAYAFYKCTELLSVGNITLNENNLSYSYETLKRAGTGGSCRSAFMGCTNLQTVGKFIRVNVVNNIEKDYSYLLSFDAMFHSCSNLQGVIDFTEWEGGTYNLLNCFFDAGTQANGFKVKLPQLVSPEINAIQGLCRGSYVTEVDFTNTDLNGVTSMYEVFRNCPKLVNIINMSIPSSIANMNNAYTNCSLLEEVPLPALLDGTCTFIQGCYGCSKLKEEPNLVEGFTNINQYIDKCTILLTPNENGELRLFYNTPSTVTILSNDSNNYKTIPETVKDLYVHIPKSCTKALMMNDSIHAKLNKPLNLHFDWEEGRDMSQKLNMNWSFTSMRTYVYNMDMLAFDFGDQNKSLGTWGNFTIKTMFNNIEPTYYYDNNFKICLIYIRFDSWDIMIEHLDPCPSDKPTQIGFTQSYGIYASVTDEQKQKMLDKGYVITTA